MTSDDNSRGSFFLWRETDILTYKFKNQLNKLAKLNY